MQASLLYVLQHRPPRSVSQDPDPFSPSPCHAARAEQLKFNPYNPSILYCASRRSTCLVQSFDVRFPKKPLETFMRPPGSSADGEKGTNQRMGFEVDLWGRYLVAGDKVSFGSSSRPSDSVKLTGICL